MVNDTDAWPISFSPSAGAVQPLVAIKMDRLDTRFLPSYFLHILRHQTDTQRCTPAVNSVKARLRIRTQRLVQGFAGKPGRLRNFTHAARTGDVAQGRRQQRRIVRFQNASDTRRLPHRCRESAPRRIQAGI